MDTSFLVGNAPTPLLNPLDIQARKIAIRNALAAGALQDQQTQANALALQQQRQDMNADAAFRARYSQQQQQPAAAAPPAVAPSGPLPFSPDGGMMADPTAGNVPAAPPPPAAAAPAAAPPTAAHDVSDNDILGFFGQKGYALIHARNEAVKTANESSKLADEGAALQKNYWGSLAFGLQAVNYDPGAVQATLSQAKAHGYENTPQYQIFAANQNNPEALKQLSAQAIAESPDQQKLLNERISSSAALMTATEKKQTSDRQAASEARGQALSALAAAPNSAAYGAIWGQLSPELRNDKSIPKPEAWTPQTAAVLQHTGQSSDQQVTTAQTASHNAATEANERTARALEARRISIEQAKFDYQKSGGDYISNPAFIDGVVNGEIKINPRDKNFAAISTAAKEQDSTWTSDRYDNRQHFMQSITSGPLSKQVQSINQGLAHLGEFKAASDKVGAIMNAVPGSSYVSGDVKAMKNSADTSGHELTVMFSQGAGTQHEVEQTQGNLTGLTQSVRNAGVNQYAKLVGGRLRAIAKQYVSATGEEFPVDRFLDSGAADLLKSQGIDAYKIAKDESQTWMKSRQVSGSPAPAAPGAPASAAPASGLQHKSTDELLQMLTNPKGK